MKTLIIVFVVALLAAAAASVFFLRGALATGSQSPDRLAEGRLWSFTTRSLAGEESSLESWDGHVALVVNVASKCGLTPQYAGLEKLYREFKDRDFVILAFPSNDFMGQEPGTAEEIRAFCSTEYGVTFPLFAKRRVKGPEKDPLYAWLTAAGLEEPTWNFTKYLVGRDGKVIARFAPRTTPDDPSLRTAIESALDSGPTPPQAKDRGD